MLPDRISNPGPLVYELGALPIALRGPAQGSEMKKEKRQPEDEVGRQYQRVDRSRWKGIVANSSVVPR